MLSNNKIKNLRVISLAVALVMLLGSFSGCKKNETGDQYISEWVWEDAQNSNGDNTDTDASSESNTSGGNNTSGGSSSTTSSGGGGSSSKPKDLKGRTITYMTWWDEPKKGSNQQAAEYWKAKNTVEKKYNCKFKFVYASDGDWQSRITASILAGDPICDVFSTQFNSFYGMKSAGLLYPLSDLKSFDFSEDKWWKPAMDLAKIDGKYYGMCISGAEFNLIQYNKNLLKQYKQPDLWELQQKGELTWQKLIEIAKACTDKSKGVYGMAPSQFPTDLLYLVGNAYGGKVVERINGSDDYKCTVNSPAMVNAFSDVNRWYAVDKIVLPCNGDYTYNSSQFGAGKVAMLMGVSVPTFYDGSTNFDFGFCIIPKGRDAKKFEPFLGFYAESTIGGGTLTYIPACAENPDDIAAVWNEIGGSIGRENWSMYYEDYLSDDIIKCLYASNDYIKAGKYSIDYGGTILSLWDSGNELFNNSVNFVKQSNSAATFIQSMENLYNSKILDMKNKK